MPQQCKTWFVPADRFRGLCDQSYDPMTGTNECPVCVQPYIMNEVVDCGPCLTTDEFSPVYKIMTAFNPPAVNVDGGLYSISRSASQTSGMGAPRNHTVTYNRRLFTFNWEDLSKLWNAPLKRIQNPASPINNTLTGCYENACVWDASWSQVIGFRELPFSDFVNCNNPGINDLFFSGITKTRWPKNLVASPWNIANGGFPCRYDSPFNTFYHCSLATDSGPKPSFTPDRNEKWPAGFDSLSGTSIPGYSSNERDLRYIDNGSAYSSPCPSALIKKAVRGIMGLSIRLIVNTTSQGNKIFWRLNINNFYFDVYWITVKNNLTDKWQPPNTIPIYGDIIPVDQAATLLGPQPDNPNWLQPHEPSQLYPWTGRREYTISYKSDPMPCSSRGLITLKQDSLNSPNPYPSTLILKAGS